MCFVCYKFKKKIIIIIKLVEKIINIVKFTKEKKNTYVYVINKSFLNAYIYYIKINGIENKPKQPTNTNSPIHSCTC